MRGRMGLDDVVHKWMWVVPARMIARPQSYEGDRGSDDGEPRVGRAPK